MATPQELQRRLDQLKIGTRTGAAQRHRQSLIRNLERRIKRQTKPAVKQQPTRTPSTRTPIPTRTRTPRPATRRTPPPRPTPQRGVSVVDHLKSVGQPSDFASRTRLAAQHGITGYRGTATQNLQLLSALRRGTPATPAATPIRPTTPRDITAPDLPTPTALDTTGANFTSMAADLENKRLAVEEAHQRQLDDINRQRDEAQKRIDEITTQQEGVIEKIEPLTAPFREEFERTERERLKVEENFFANQALTNELNTLLTEGNELIKQQRGVTGLTVIRNPRIAQTISDISARAGVIQAVMSARTGQIGEAYRLIDRSLRAMNADRQDQLGYLNTLMNFYDKERDTEGRKLITLTREQRSFMDAEIGRLESDLQESEANAQNIKDLMINPRTALLMARAGVSLNDNTETASLKIARQVEIEEAQARQVEIEEAQGGDRAGEVETFAREVAAGRIRITGVPQRIRAEVMDIVHKGGGVTPQVTPPDTPQVSWEDYLTEAQDILNMSIDPESSLYRDLQKQYKVDFPGTPDTSGVKFTNTELKRLEQAGLLNAERQEQLDFLFGRRGRGGVTNPIR